MDLFTYASSLGPSRHIDDETCVRSIRNKFQLLSHTHTHTHTHTYYFSNTSDEFIYILLIRYLALYNN